MARQDITNGEDGLSVRNALNGMFTELYSVFEQLPGIVPGYATKAAALVALPGLADGAAIEVETDESDLGNRTLYIKTAGAIGNILLRIPKLVAGQEPYYDDVTLTRFVDTVIDGVRQPAIVPHVYIDPVNGNDGWDGLHGYRVGATTQGPIKTGAALLVHPYLKEGVCIGILNGSEVMRDTIDLAEPHTGNGNRQLSRFSVVGYGIGAPRKISTLDIAPNASFTAHATIAGAYQIAWNHFLYDTATARFTVLENDEPLNRVATKAETATAGTYWFAAVTAPGTPATIVVHPWAGDSAITNGKVYEITKRHYAVSGRDGLFLQYLHGYAAGHNNGVFFAYDQPKWRALFAEMGTKHNWVAGPGWFNDVIACTGMALSNYSPEGGSQMATLFLGDPHGANAYLDNCAWIIDPSLYTHTDGGIGGGNTPYYCHGVTGGFGTMYLTNCWDSKVGQGGFEAAAVFTNHYSVGKQGNNTGLYNVGGSVTVRGGLFKGGTRWIDSPANADLEGAVLVVDPGSASFYSGATGINLRLVGNMFIGAGASIPAIVTCSSIVLAGSSITIRENIFTNTANIYEFGANASAPTLIDIDFNYYDRYPGADHGGMYDNDTNHYLALYKNVTHSFATWQAAGFDTHGQQGATPSAGWTSGLNPALTHVDIRLNATGPAYALRTSIIDQATINAYEALPVTRAGCLARIQSPAVFKYPIVVL